MRSGPFTLSKIFRTRPKQIETDRPSHAGAKSALLRPRFALGYPQKESGWEVFFEESTHFSWIYL